MVKNLVIYKDDNSKRKADFNIGNNEANGISLTDPYYYKYTENKTKSNPFRIGDAIIIVSLPNNPPYYKFVAKIFAIR